jgi:catechol 2,3-dioxygenase-like lactoylglutathione lyase family enzyme
METNWFGSRRICQVGLVVRDLERAARTYAELFGVAVPQIVTTAGEETAHTRYRGAPTPARAKLAFFDMGGLSLELIEPIGGPSTWQEFLDTKGEGVHHIAFHVEGTDHITGGLAGKGIPVVQQGDYTGGRYTYVSSEAALGVMVELLESTGK